SHGPQKKEGAQQSKRNNVALTLPALHGAVTLRWYRCVSHSVLISSEAFTTAFRAQSGAAADRKIK
ncbi:hypothetical protein JTM52_36035, partial [Pseudomonas aeruginosa]|nr:hypothetical protein [Pseudomonas aeruginosa]